MLLAVTIVGAVASDAHGAHPAGVAVSVATAAFLAVLVVFLDDVLSLFAVGSPNLATEMAGAVAGRNRCNRESRPR